MTDELWWKKGVIYQVYPRSLQDTTGDGVGDIEGIRRRLDDLVWLGVDALWISPIYPSPMADFGYDVADYCGIDPLFGTLADIDRLIADMHARGLRLILDFVPNHTSDQHPWFKESRSSRTSARRDWYIWRDAKPDGALPNNWISNFGGPAWTFDAQTGQFYLHSFLREQPDLNWRNPAVQAAMYDALRFWLGRGVDGFRVDVMWLMIKDAALRDNPPNPDYRPGQAEINRLVQIHNADQPEVHAVVAAMRGVLDEFGERVLIGEIYLPLDKLVTYYGKGLAGAQMPFNFQLIQAPWNARGIAALIRDYEAALPPGGWPNWVLGNHDQPRIAARVGAAQARVATVLLLTLRGTPTLYYGDEIGLAKVAIPPGAARDPWERNEPGLGRDPSRTPFQWDASNNAGFTTGAPWLPLDADYPTRNAAVMRDDPASILMLTRSLLALRRAHPALSQGTYREIEVSADVLVFERRHGEGRVVVALNFGAQPQRPAALTGLAVSSLLMSSVADSGRSDLAVLGPDEAMIVSCPA